MPNTRIYSRSFAGGEMSPEMFGRIDADRYQNGAAKMRNMVAKPSGPVMRRPGFQFVRASKQSEGGASTSAVRLIPFRYGVGQQYALEFGDYYIRVHQNGGTLTVDPNQPAGVSTATVSAIDTGAIGLNNPNPRFQLSANSATNTFTTVIGNHGLSAGDRVDFYVNTASTLPAPLQLGVSYYVIASGLTLTAFKISATSGGSEIDITDTGTGTFGAERIVSTMTVQTSAAHGMQTGDLVRITANPNNVTSDYQWLTLNRDYYAIRVSEDRLAFSETLTGALQRRRLVLQPGYAGSAADYRVSRRYLNGELISYSGSVWRAKADLPLTWLGTTLGGSDWQQLPGDNTLEIATGIPAAALHQLHYVQSYDVLTLTHPSYAPLELRRYSADRWELRQIDFGYSLPAPDFYNVRARPGPINSLEGIVVDNTGFPPQTQDTYTRAFCFAGVPNLGVGSRVYIDGTKISTLDGKFFTVNGQKTGGVTDGVLGYTRVTLTDDETGRPWTLNTLQPAVSATFDTITIASHGLENGCKVRLVRFANGALPAPLSEGTTYYVVEAAVDTFKLSTTDGGTAINITQNSNYVAGGLGIDRIVVAYKQGTVREVFQTNLEDHLYKVVAVDSEGGQGEATSVRQVLNNIYEAGAYNLAYWQPLIGNEPLQYKIYKRDLGAYSIVGSVDRIEDWQYDQGVQIDAGTPLVVTIPGAELKNNDPVSFERGPNWSGLDPSGTFNWNTAYFVQRIETGINAGKYYLLFYPDGGKVRADTTVTGLRAKQWLQFRDDGVAPDAGDTLPFLDQDAYSDSLWPVFETPGNYPSATTYFEQRRLFGGTNNAPQTLWATRSGTESDMGFHIPALEDDRIKVRMAARESARILHLVPLNELLVLTDSGEWRVGSAEAGAVSPANIQIRAQSYIGSAEAQPVVINNIVVFAAARGGHIRELGYSNDRQGYLTGDLSLRAAHLFDDFTIADLAYQKAPLPMVWAVSSSGKLLGMTYVPEERVASWHQHDTDGSFESVCVLEEGTEDRLYAVVRRTINGVTKRYIERMDVMAVQQLADCRYMDSWLQYSGSPVSVVSGLSHLNGKQVTILADGRVHASRTVVNGSVSLDVPASNVAVGLPYTSELQTLPAIMQVDGFGTGRTKNIGRAWIRVFESTGFRIGTDASNLTPHSPDNTTPSLQTGVLDVTVPPTWAADGQVLVEQSNPVPLTVTGMTLEMSIGG